MGLARHPAGLTALLPSERGECEQAAEADDISRLNLMTTRAA
jgi:hypothetical protein